MDYFTKINSEVFNMSMETDKVLLFIFILNILIVK